MLKDIFCWDITESRNMVQSETTAPCWGPVSLLVLVRPSKQVSLPLSISCGWDHRVQPPLHPKSWTVESWLPRRPFSSSSKAKSKQITYNKQLHASPCILCANSQTFVTFVAVRYPLLLNLFAPQATWDAKSWHRCPSRHQRQSSSTQRGPPVHGCFSRNATGMKSRSEGHKNHTWENRICGASLGEWLNLRIMKFHKYEPKRSCPPIFIVFLKSISLEVHGSWDGHRPVLSSLSLRSRHVVLWLFGSLSGMNSLSKATSMNDPWSSNKHTSSILAISRYPPSFRKVH